MENKDTLKQLFQEMPEDRLSVEFTLNVMQKVRAEAERARRRKVCLNYLWLALASGILISLTIYALCCNSLSIFSMPENPFRDLFTGNLMFYLFIGVLAGVLLALDYRLRKFMHESGKM